MVMTEDQDPDVFINEIYHVRDELVEMGKVMDDDSLLDLVLEGLMIIIRSVQRRGG